MSNRDLVVRQVEVMPKGPDADQLRRILYHVTVGEHRVVLVPWMDAGLEDNPEFPPQLMITIEGRVRESRELVAIATLPAARVPLLADAVRSQASLAMEDAARLLDHEFTRVYAYLCRLQARRFQVQKIREGS